MVISRALSYLSAIILGRIKSATTCLFSYTGLYQCFELTPGANPPVQLLASGSLQISNSDGSVCRISCPCRKHRANDAKCKELGWLCVPLVAETYDAWGNEAVEAFSQLASRLATLTCRPKSAVLGDSDIYGRLNLHLVRANATAILTRCILN
ncbi:hypothetical protein EMCRGX_G001677 [Ephydatia muelleri]